MAVHVITIQQSRPGKFDVRLGDDQRLFVESSAQPFLESAAALLSGGLALPSDELIMKLNLAAHGTRSGGARSGMPSGMRRGARLCVRSEGGLLDSGPVDNASRLPTSFPGNLLAGARGRGHARVRAQWARSPRSLIRSSLRLVQVSGGGGWMSCRPPCGRAPPVRRRRA